MTAYPHRHGVTATNVSTTHGHPQTGFECVQSPCDYGLWTLAGRNDAGGRALLVANPSDWELSFQLSWEGDCSSTSVTEISDLSGTFRRRSVGSRVRIPAWGTQLLVL